MKISSLNQMVFAVAMVSIAGMMQAISIDMVPVGTAGNESDPASGNLYGAMGYIYQISKCEVMVRQYTQTNQPPRNDGDIGAKPITEKPSSDNALSVPKIPQKVRWEAMLPYEFIEARDRFSVCYMAYGLAEPHGAYNALGLDWLKADALVELAASQEGVVVAPPFAWHIQEVPEFHDDGKGNGWLCDVGVRQSFCSSIPADLFYRTVFSQIRAMDARGFHAAILVTGHAGGPEKVMRKICEYYTHSSGSPIRLYAIADSACIAKDLPYPGDHAGICETSQLMALHPGLTDLSRWTGNEEMGKRFAAGVNFEKGPLPSQAIGERIVQSQVRNLCGTAKRLLTEYRSREGWKAPDLNQTEEMWKNFERMTRSYWTLSYADLKKGKPYADIPDWDILEKQ